VLVVASDVDATEIDITFTKFKAKGARRLTFKQFRAALAALAEKRYPALEPRPALQLLIAAHVMRCPPALPYNPQVGVVLHVLHPRRGQCRAAMEARSAALSRAEPLCVSLCVRATHASPPLCVQQPASPDNDAEDSAEAARQVRCLDEWLCVYCVGDKCR
jgi:hypothetical protein